MPQSTSVDEAVARFRRTPWCAALLDRPDTLVHLPMSRRVHTPDRSLYESQDRLFRTALNNNGGVPWMLTFHVEPGSDPAAPNSTPAPAPNPDTTAGLPLAVHASSVLFALGPDVIGFAGTTHGGFLVAMMDESMGSLLFANYEYQLRQQAAARARGTRWTPPPGILHLGDGVRILTASMNVRLLQPLVAPCDAVVSTATLARVDGRKIYIDVDIRNDADGTVFARCEGMWVVLKTSALALGIGKGKAEVKAKANL